MRSDYGASKGLGRAIAEELAKEGANISLCARGKEDLEATAQALRGHGVTVAAIPADVAKAEGVQRVIDATLSALGRIDILVNNAGMAWLDHTLTTTDEQWQYCMEINLFSGVRFAIGQPLLFQHDLGLGRVRRAEGAPRVIAFGCVKNNHPPGKFATSSSVASRVRKPEAPHDRYFFDL